MADPIRLGLWVYMYTILIVISALAIYGVARRPSMIKKIIALSIFGDTANVFAIFIGFRAGGPGSVLPPVYPTVRPSPSDIENMLKVSVDPLPQVLVLTAIVINMAVTALLIFLAIQLYRAYGTLDARKIARLRG